MKCKSEKKRALITGATRGLGKATAISLANTGVEVMLVARNELELKTLTASLNSENGQIHRSIACDLMNVADFDQLADEIGAVDIIVHNLGGTLGKKSAFSLCQDYQTVWYFNVGVAIELNNRLIPLMQRNQWGRVIHVSSIAATLANASPPYSSAKAALNTYVKCLGQRVAEDSVIVSAIMPGPFWCPDKSEGHLPPSGLQEYAHDRLAIKRLSEAAEIAELIVFLSSDAATLMAGEVIPITGGIIA